MSDHQQISVDEAKARGYDPAVIEKIQKNEAAHADAASLIPQIEAAFTAIPRPKITLSVARALDDEWILSDERMAELASQDTEQSWQEVSHEAVAYHQEYFVFADAEGWRFYLPALMTHCLRDFPHWGWSEPLQACTKRTHIELLSKAQLQ